MNESSNETVRQIQAIVYKILCDVDEYCSREKLTYYLSGGSCLGAVRHQGFIPWDDDADIMLPRNDYEKFLREFGKAYVWKYRVGCLETDAKWCRTYARIWDLNTELIQTKVEDMNMGIFVDVFPIDGLPKNKLSQKIYFTRIKVLNVLRNAAIRTDFYDYEKYRHLKKILSYLAKPMGARYFAEEIDRLGRKHSFENSQYVAASLAVHYGEKEIIEREYGKGN